MLEGEWYYNSTTRRHRRATGRKVAVEVADDYVPAGSPRRPPGVACVSRPKISRAREVREGGVYGLNYARNRPRWRCGVP
jgi:hypothetical protein